MLTAYERRNENLLFSIFLALLIGVAFFVGIAVPTFADTIGDVLDNSTLHVVTDSQGIPSIHTTKDSFPSATDQMWSMYQIPGLGRESSVDEGSFVRWAYNGWAGAGSTPLATDIGKDASAANVKKTTTDWNNGTTASPIAVSFKNTKTEDGLPYFSLNYVDKNDLVDFGTSTLAPWITQAWAGQAEDQLKPEQQAPIFNPNKVVSKMKSQDGTISGKPLLDTGSNQSFTGGYLQATGNVPISAAIASSTTAVDSSMSGNWAVMVRVKTAPGIDARALAASVDWNKSYYYLTIKSITIFGSTFTINFPLQFDHHIYLDPKDSQSFFLKVKGIPYWVKQTGSDPDNINSTTQLQLTNPKADYVDYLNNRQLTAGFAQTAATLDFIDDKNGTSMKQTNMDNTALINSDFQPRFTKKNHFPGAVLVPARGNPLWNIWDAAGGSLKKGALFQAGPTGQMITLLNVAGDKWIKERNPGGSLGMELYKWIVNWFTSETFTGSAHINFSFDMSKYANYTSKDAQALTAGRFPAAPKADGTFNGTSGTDASDAVQITLYDSAQLVDPYGVIPKDTKNYPRNDTDRESKVRKILQTSESSAMWATSGGIAGMTPADYAVINKDLVEHGTRYPTYTNFTSWTGAIVPYDRMHWNDGNDTVQANFTDTLHSDGKLGSDINNRTATPDPALDGLLANSGNAFILKQQDAYREAAKALQPIFIDGKLTTAGLINPERYANVYQLYDYTQSTSTVNVHLADYSATKPKVTASTGTNLIDNVITSNLDGKKWRYTGEMDNGGGLLPLADATLSLQQTFKPTLNLSNQKLLTVAESAVTDQHWVRQLGTWRDPLGIAQSDSLVMDFDGLTSHQQAKTATLGGNTDSHTVTGDWSTLNQLDSTGTNAEMVVDASQNVTAKYQLPVAGNTNDNFFYGSGTLNRDNKNVQIASGYTLASGVDDTATDNYYLLLDRDSPTDQWYTAEKEFTVGNKTIHYLQKGDDTVHVKVTVTHKEGSKLPTGKDLIVRIPNVQLDKNHVGATIPIVTAKTSDAGNSVTVSNTGEPTDNWLAENFTSRKLTFTRVPQQFTYEFDYKIVDQSNIPLLTQYEDMIIVDSRTLAISNGVQFDLLKSANLTHVPTFDFGTHSIPNAAGTAANPYVLVDQSVKTAAFFSVQSNNDNKSSWTLWGTLNHFANNDQSRLYNNFTVAMGQPQMLNSATNTFGNEPNVTKPTGTDTTKFTDGEWRYYNHSPADLISNGYQTQLYRLDRTYGDKDNKETTLSRYYPNTTLAVPAGVSPAITPGQYTANITYLLSDDGTLK